MEDVALLEEEDVQVARSSQSQGKYLAAIRQLGDKASTKAVAGAVGVVRSAAQSALRKLEDAGEVERKDERSPWRLATDVEGTQGEF